MGTEVWVLIKTGSSYPGCLHWTNTITWWPHLQSHSRLSFHPIVPRKLERAYRESLNYFLLWPTALAGLPSSLLTLLDYIPTASNKVLVPSLTTPSSWSWLPRSGYQILKSSNQSPLVATLINLSNQKPLPWHGVSFYLYIPPFSYGAHLSLLCIDTVLRTSILPPHALSPVFVSHSLPRVPLCSELGLGISC